MAVVAIDAVVHVSADTAVSSVRLGPGMAIGALEDCVVAGIGMTGGAHSISTAMGHGKPGVIEGGVEPSRG